MHQETVFSYGYNILKSWYDYIFQTTHYDSYQLLGKVKNSVASIVFLWMYLPRKTFNYCQLNHNINCGKTRIMYKLSVISC